MKLLPITFHLIYLLFLIFCNIASSQIDLECNGRDMHSIYGVATTGIYRIDSVDTNPTNPVLIAQLPRPNLSGGGISINKNLDSIEGPVTMYFIQGGINYHFWNGKGWTNTGRSSGNPSAVNPGGTSSYIFDLDGQHGNLYRYDGKNNGTILVSNISPQNTLIYDVATDSKGNFYLFNTLAHKIICYNSIGVPIDSFTTTGAKISSADCGFVILGNRMYVGNCDSKMGLYEGIKSGNNIDFTLLKSYAIRFLDMAACPSAAMPLVVFQNQELPHFTIFPNPAHDYVIIKSDDMAVLKITDYMGIIKETININGLDQYHLNINKWTAGVYFINAFSRNKTSSRRMLIIQ